LAMLSLSCLTLAEKYLVEMQLVTGGEPDDGMEETDGSGDTGALVLQVKTTQATTVLCGISWP